MTVMQTGRRESKKVKRGNLPRLVSELVTVTEAVAQGQNPAHMTFSSLPVRQACCSSLHCQQRERGGDGRGRGGGGGGG